MTDVRAARAEEDLEDLFDELDVAGMDIPSDIREARMQAVSDYKKFTAKGGYGEFEEIVEEREVLEITAKEDKCIVHFMIPTFERCQIMDVHLNKIASQHFKTRTIKVNASNCPWLCTRLGIRELPAILCFVSGVCKDRIVGMGDFGGKDDFKTARLEARIGQCGVIHCAGSAAIATNTKMFGFDVKKGAQDSDTSSGSEDSD